VFSAALVCGDASNKSIDVGRRTYRPSLCKACSSPSDQLLRIEEEMLPVKQQ
jgi:hypothetical protein